MKAWLLFGMAWLVGGCGGDSDDNSDLIHTTEPCKVDGDCKMDPGRVSCRDSKTAVRYEVATCGTDKLCAWGPFEHHCDLRCEDGYCITADVR
jgi:hypothetical protein